MTGISFVPDKELLQNTKGRIVHFEHSAPQGSVGHSVEYTEEQMRQSLIEWFSEHDYLTRPLMIKCWHVTEYRATKWLQLFTTGDDSLLERRRQAGTSFYYLRRTSA